MLAQRQSDNTVRSIAYASRSLQPHESNYGITKLEGLGVVWAVKHFRPYLYGQTCTVYTDHEALKPLLKKPQPSGKLARWGMAIQELDLEIRHRSGKHNANADALSRHPLPVEESVDASPPNQVVAVVVQLNEEGLPELQRADPELSKAFQYLETGILPEDQNAAKKLALTESQYLIKDAALYHVENNGNLRVIPPAYHRERLFQEAHGGPYGTHLGDLKVFSELRRHYWWPGMWADIPKWTRACIVCAMCNTGRAVRPPLSPIPVGGPFDRVDVDVLQFPRSKRGN